jgi:hypothetical protein
MTTFSETETGAPDGVTLLGRLPPPPPPLRMEVSPRLTTLVGVWRWLGQTAR